MENAEVHRKDAEIHKKSAEVHTKKAEVHKQNAEAHIFKQIPQQESCPGSFYARATFFTIIFLPFQAPLLFLPSQQSYSL